MLRLPRQLQVRTHDTAGFPPNLPVLHTPDRLPDPTLFNASQDQPLAAEPIHRPLERAKSTVPLHLELLTLVHHRTLVILVPHMSATLLLIKLADHIYLEIGTSI